MNLEQIINDKIGRKQIIAVVALVCLDGNPGYQMSVVVTALLAQAFTDWRQPRGKSRVKSKGK